MPPCLPSALHKDTSCERGRGHTLFSRKPLHAAIQVQAHSSYSVRVGCITAATSPTVHGHPARRGPSTSTSHLRGWRPERLRTSITQPVALEAGLTPRPSPLLVLSSTSGHLGVCFPLGAWPAPAGLLVRRPAPPCWAIGMHAHTPLCWLVPHIPVLNWGLSSQALLPLGKLSPGCHSEALGSRAHPLLVIQAVTSICQHACLLYLPSLIYNPAQINE